MASPEVVNHTPFAFEPLFLADEEGRPLFVAVVKATYRIEGGGAVCLSDQQVPVDLTGKWLGKPGESSCLYEPDTAFVKPATDVVLIGHACAPARGVTEVTVELRIGPLRKMTRVVGDRVWIKSLGLHTMTRPRPFERIPLVYERAFGGWDRSHPDCRNHRFEARNPIGTGYHHKGGQFEEGIRLPNLEDPRSPIKNFTDAPPPAGFGFVSPHWQPRAALGGTYDGAWLSGRMPLLPKDFDRRFFNAAPADLTVPGYLKGNEEALLTNGSPGKELKVRLPGPPPPICRVELNNREDRTVETRLDTIVIDADRKTLILVWRGNLTLRSGPYEVRSVEVWPEAVPPRVVSGADLEGDVEDQIEDSGADEGEGAWQ